MCSYEAKTIPNVASLKTAQEKTHNPPWARQAGRNEWRKALRRRLGESGQMLRYPQEYYELQPTAIDTQVGSCSAPTKVASPSESCDGDNDTTAPFASKPILLPLRKSRDTSHFAYGPQTRF